MQRASPASTRCSGVQASSSGSGEPPRCSSPPLRGRARPRRRTSSRCAATTATYTRAMALAILGVTGYTGRLVLDEARRAGLEVRLVGRRREALEELAVARGGGARRRRARRGCSAEAFAGAAVVASLAGPFLELGLAPSRAALRRRALPRHERRAGLGQARARRARRAETVVLPGLRLRLRPRRPRRPARRGAGRRPARRDRRRLLGQGRRHEPRHAPDDRPRDGPGSGRLGGRAARPSRFGATTRTVRFPFGERTVVEWSGTEPLTVPRHTDVRNVRSYIRAPGLGGEGRRAREAGSTVRPAGLAGSGPSGPSEASRRREPLRGRRRGARPGGEGPRRRSPAATSTASPRS